MAAKKRLLTTAHKPNLHKAATARRKIVLRQLMQGMAKKEIVRFHGVSEEVFNSDVERITMNRNLTPRARKRIAKSAYPITAEKHQKPLKKAEARATVEFLYKSRKAKLEEIEGLKKRLSRTTNEKRGNFIQAKIKGILSTM